MYGHMVYVMRAHAPVAMHCFTFQILSMIEEAAGTKLYESKRESARKTIEKKDAKLKEMDSVISQILSVLQSDYI